jgi:hypothetical protein
VALTFPGRVEALAKVPAGGASVSATVANGAGAQSVTVPAANYFLTTAGGVSSLLTTLQTQLNQAPNLMGFPQSAAAVASAIGYGTWSAGWLCQESSGSLAAVFGSPSLAAVSSPTYQNAGTKTGDYAIGFDSTLDAFSGGDVYDVTATDDLVFAWVGKTTSIAADKDWFAKYAASVGYFIYKAATDCFLLAVNDGTGAVTAVTSSAAANSWHVGIALVDRGANQIRIGIRTLAGVSSISSTSSIAGKGSLASAANLLVGNGSITGNGADTSGSISAIYIGTGSGIASTLNTNISTALTNFANAINASWSVSYDSSGGTGRVSIGWTGYSAPTWSLSWTSTTLRDVLGFASDISGVTTTQTGTAQSPMVWFPDAPLNCDDHPSMTPDETDLRGSESPTGVLLSLSGNTKYAHTNVRWPRSPVSRIREGSATYANASLEVFFRNCIAGTGSISWFVPGNDLQIYWSNAGSDALLGSDANSGLGVAGWRPAGIAKFSELTRPSQQGWVGQFDVRFPRLVSNG